MSNTNTTNPSRRQRKMKLKTEIGTLATVTAHESANLVKFALKSGANLAEALYIETESLVHSSRVDGLLDKLESSVEAIEALRDFGHSEEEITKEIAELKKSHIANVLKQAS